MIRSMVGIPIYKQLDDKVIRLIQSIKDYTEGEYRLYFPVSNRSHSVQVNDCIRAAKNSSCEYLAIVDADAWFDEKSKGWLQKYETALDSNKEYGLLYWSNDFRQHCDRPQYADESQATPYIASILWFYRLSNNLWWDENYLYNQSSDIDFVREHRRQKILTGYLPSIHINHLWDMNESSPQYCRWKLTNEVIFYEKWQSICHDQNFNNKARNKYRGIYGREDLDLLKDYSDQWRNLKPYFDESNTLFLNDLEYLKRQKIRPLCTVVNNDGGYYSIDEQDPLIMPQDIFTKLLHLQSEIDYF